MEMWPRNYLCELFADVFRQLVDSGRSGASGDVCVACLSAGGGSVACVDGGMLRGLKVKTGVQEHL